MDPSHIHTYKEQEDDFNLLFTDTALGEYGTNDDFIQPAQPSSILVPQSRHVRGVASDQVGIDRTQAPALRSPLQEVVPSEARQYEEDIQYRLTTAAANTSVSPTLSNGDLIKNTTGTDTSNAQTGEVDDAMRQLLDMYNDPDPEWDRLIHDIGELGLRIRTGADEVEPWPGFAPWEQTDTRPLDDWPRLSQMGISMEEASLIMSSIDDWFESTQATVLADIKKRLSVQDVKTFVENEVMIRLDGYGEPDSNTAMSRLGVMRAIVRLFIYRHRRKVQELRDRGKLSEEPMFGPLRLVDEINQDGRVVWYQDLFVEQKTCYEQFLDDLARHYAPYLEDGVSGDLDLRRLELRKKGWRTVTKSEDDGSDWTQRSDNGRRVFCISPARDAARWIRLGNRQFEQIRDAYIQKKEQVWIFVMPEDMYQEAKDVPGRSHQKEDRFDFIRSMRLNTSRSRQEAEAPPYPPLELSLEQLAMLHADRSEPLLETWDRLDEQWKKEVIWQKDEME
ncbi:hypothetical protein EJ05DRAFT_496325 [Pseudovirgaria hyperparasitica]|uniref:Uncharacterized protein n=1 Tax=Pseudovirgaria hyperparasitica TaxID=470096 RepID=A0A6A6WN48_9PEZI|nr:uncharacterized protein EJ05DRAFT_496325 [Pseudovirgaria hyperparasitica]KAF2763506.1 hypothetical protein EJ05DRAFT_496325 [Pseudovirgaria hyperparasitica]